MHFPNCMATLISFCIPPFYAVTFRLQPGIYGILNIFSNYYIHVYVCINTHNSLNICTIIGYCKRTVGKHSNAKFILSIYTPSPMHQHPQTSNTSWPDRRF